MLEFKNISKQFSTVKVLHDISFSIDKGKLIALMGENGAGKSTLMKILCGVYPDFQGEVILKNNQVQFKNPRDAEHAGIAMIHQELNLIPDLSIAENIFLGKEPINSMGVIDSKTMLSKSDEILKEFDFPYSSRIKIKNIPVGWQQMVEIAKALQINAEIIVMDEPTSALSESEINILFEKINLLKEMGKTIIYISHRMKEIFTLADEVVVLRDGRFVGQELIDNVTNEKLIQMMIGHEIQDNSVEITKKYDKEILHIDNLNVIANNKSLLSDINFTLKKGEILGVAGLLGAGRTELLKYLFGELKGEAKGNVKYITNDYRPKSASDSIRMGIMYLSEDRKREGNFHDLSLVFNSSISILDRLSKFGFVNNQTEKKEVIQRFEKLNVKKSSILQKMNTLSGGNQQKVLLSRVLSTEPVLLMLDEPTRGIDVGAKEEIYNLINELSSAGMTIIVTSSEIPELMQVCHRVLVLSQGKQTALLKVEDTNPQEILHYAFMQE